MLFDIQVTVLSYDSQYFVVMRVSIQTDEL